MVYNRFCNSPYNVLISPIPTSFVVLIMQKALPFIDNLTLRANGIVVTSDDCSVECSLASLISMDEDDFDASPGSIFTESDDSEFGEEEHSVVTEVGAIEDEQLEEKEENTEVEEADEEKIEVTVEEDTTKEEEDVQEREPIVEEKDDEEEYVNLTQELTDSDNEDDFVDVCAELEK